MKYGFVFPGRDARTAANVALEAEQHGWDGLFVWEPVWGVDAWVQLTAAAMLTERITLGTMISPLSRMRPWDMAGKAVALHNLSGGRLVLSVGLGAPDTGWAAFGEITDRKTRAELLDESLDIMRGLWKGQPFEYTGKHYRIKPCNFLPPPPPLGGRVPIWCVGAWGSQKSMRRALRCDGLLPTVVGEQGARQANVDEVRAIAAFVAAHVSHPPQTLPVGGRGEHPYDIVVEGTTPGDDPSTAAETTRTWAQAGATWWIEAMWGAMDTPEAVLERIRQGPPRG